MVVLPDILPFSGFLKWTVFDVLMVCFPWKSVLIGRQNAVKWSVLTTNGFMMSVWLSGQLYDGRGVSPLSKRLSALCHNDSGKSHLWHSLFVCSSKQEMKSFFRLFFKLGSRRNDRSSITSTKAFMILFTLCIWFGWLWPIWMISHAIWLSLQPSALLQLSRICLMRLITFASKAASSLLRCICANAQRKTDKCVSFRRLFSVCGCKSAMALLG